MSAHPESRWTHPVCDDCWFQDNSTETDEGTLLRPPTRLVDGARKWEQCCKCGSMTFAGIYVRGDANSEEFEVWCSESRKNKS